MEWFFDNYLNGPQDQRDPRVNLVADDLQGLSPTTIINAPIDPLRSEGEILAQGNKKERSREVSAPLLSGTRPGEGVSVSPAPLSRPAPRPERRRPRRGRRPEPQERHRPRTSARG
ncbi:MAG: alpha/beta hydrolase fold domain-containing protein [Gemmatimonadota bacterium]|nr:alpha/beta hydrolase fold domain-containing protein [Gemmatimonadota bacterium]